MNTDFIYIVITVIAMCGSIWAGSGYMAWITAWTIGHLTERNLANGLSAYLKRGLIMWALLIKGNPVLFETNKTSSNAST